MSGVKKDNKMMYPDVMRNQIDTLNENLSNLNTQIDNSSKSSNKLQKWLIRWTVVMASAVVIQAILIAIQIF
jgi:hypothetical protein